MMVTGRIVGTEKEGEEESDKPRGKEEKEGREDEGES